VSGIHRQDTVAHHSYCMDPEVLVLLLAIITSHLLRGFCLLPGCCAVFTSMLHWLFRVSFIGAVFYGGGSGRRAE